MPHSPENEYFFKELPMTHVAGALSLGEIFALHAPSVKKAGKADGCCLGDVDFTDPKAVEAIFDNLGEIDDEVFEKGLKRIPDPVTVVDEDSEEEEEEEEEKGGCHSQTDTIEDLDDDWDRIQTEMKLAKEKPDPYEAEFSDEPSLFQGPRQTYTFTPEHRSIISDIRSRVGTETDVPVASTGLDFTFSTSTVKKPIEGERARIMESEINELRTMMGKNK